MSDKQLHTFNGMEFLRNRYTESKLSDSSFATLMTEKLDAPYSIQQARNYRITLGIANNAPADSLVKAKDLLRRLHDNYDGAPAGAVDSANDLSIVMQEVWDFLH